MMQTFGSFHWRKLILLFILVSMLPMCIHGQGACPISSAIQVIVHPDPVINIISPNQTICTGAEITIEANPDFGTGTCEMQWQFSLNGSNWLDLPGQNDSTLMTGILTQTTYYRIILTCSGSDCNTDISNVVIITVLPTPSLSISGQNAVCTGSPVTLNAISGGGLGGFTYQWQYLNSQGSFVDLINETNAQLNIPALLTDMTYKVKAIGTGLSCENQATKLVAANNKPIVNVSNNGPFCAPSDLELVASGGQTYQWSGPNGFSDSGATITINNADINLAGTYIVTATNSASCTATGFTKVVISPCKEICDNTADDDGDGLTDCVDLDCGVGPFDLNISGNLGFCNGGSVILSVPASYAALWSNGSTQSNITVANTGNYAVTVTNVNGCTATGVRNIEVWPQIVNQIAPVLSAYCENVDINIAATGASSQVWRGPNNFQWNGDHLSINKVQTNQSGWYVLTGSNSFGCNDIDSIFINVQPGPKFLFVEDQYLTCTNNSVQLNAQSVTNNLTYQWQGVGGFTSSQQQITTSLSGVYTVTATSSNNCSASVSAQVISNNSVPTVTANYSSVINCISDTVWLTAIGSPSKLDYQWSGPNGFTSIGYEIEVSQGGIYTVIAINPLNGCAAQANVNVPVNKEVPSILAQGGKIKCDSPLCQLLAQSNHDADFYWSGPNGFKTISPNPVVGFVGQFTVQATSKVTGCRSVNAQVNVEFDEEDDDDDDDDEN